MRPEQFLEIIGPRIKPREPKLGTIPVDYVSGRPAVQFDGEDTASTRTYPYFAHYTPAVGDRVLLIPVGNGYIVAGKIV